MNEGKIEVGDSVITLRLPREVDHHILGLMRHSLDAKLFLVKPTRLVIDFSSVELMDSSAIGLVLGRLEICERVGASLTLSGVNARAKRLLELGGALRVKGINIE